MTTHPPSPGPLSSAMADWPEGADLLLGSLVHGLVVGLLVVAVALVVRAR